MLVLGGEASYFGVAHASVHCGMVVEEQLILDRDLQCDGPALVLRNPRAILQLNGHTVELHRLCSEGKPAAGVLVETTAERAQILGPGMIRGFATGIRIDGADHVQVRDVRISSSCAEALVVRDAIGVEGRNLIIDRNGAGPPGSAALRVEQAKSFALADSEFFSNGGGADTAAVDMRGCDSCRLTGNRVVANHGMGVRLDTESHGNEIEHNVILDQRPYDVVDQGFDNIFALNVFERGDGVSPPALWPLVGAAGPITPGVAGCGTLNASIPPRRTITLVCPQDPGLRAMRNSVVAYRFLNPINTRMPFGETCDPVEVLPATSGGGGALRCTNANPTWSVVLELTCCLN